MIFEPGARTFWHIHPAGQFFTVLRGEGRTGVYGEKARIVKPGDVVICPAGVKHFHGAAPDSQMVQMTVTGDHREGKGVTWLEEVTDEQYNKPRKIRPEISNLKFKFLRKTGWKQVYYVVS